MDKPVKDKDLRPLVGSIQQRVITLRVMRETFEADLMEQPPQEPSAIAEEQ